MGHLALRKIGPGSVYVLVCANPASHFYSPPQPTLGLSLPISKPLHLPSMKEMNWMGLQDRMRSDRESVQCLIVFSWDFDVPPCQPATRLAPMLVWQLHSKRSPLNSLPGDPSLGAGAVSQLALPLTSYFQKLPEQESHGKGGFNT